MENKTEILDVLRKVAEKTNWKNFDVDSNFTSENVHDFCGELFTGSIRNKDTNEKLNLAIKKPSKIENKRDEIKMRASFLKEIYFYSNIVPCYEQLLKEKGIQDELKMVANYYVGITEEYNETLVLSNLKKLGYDTLERAIFLNDEQICLVFKTYGKLHALSFVLKDQKPADYKNLTKGIVDFYQELWSSESFSTALANTVSDCLNCLDDQIKEHCAYFLLAAANKFINLANYKGEYSCILHGDGWLDNMMFKYNHNKLESIKLINFQFVREGTPIFDLADFFYSGGSKETFKNLDKYLQIYYDSFSETVTLLGSNANKIFPFASLKNDWKKYSTFSLLMTMLNIKIKLTGTQHIKENYQIIFNSVKVYTSNFRQKVRDMVEHLYENGFI